MIVITIKTIIKKINKSFPRLIFRDFVIITINIFDSFTKNSGNSNMLQ